MGIDRPARVIDLFAGAGGMSRGFHDVRQGGQSVFGSILAVEHDPAAAHTYKANFDAEVRDEPIEHVLHFPPAEVIIGGPPCQGFSPLGRDRDDVSRGAMNDLWRHYLRAVKQVRPLVFVIENVPEFLASSQYQAFEQSFEDDEELGDYVVRSRVLHAVDYGVAQRRRRGFVIGSRIGEPLWPVATHGPGRQHPFATVRDAIGDLPESPTNLDWHIGRKPRPSSIERYRAVPEGGNRFDLARNRPDLLPDCWARKKTGTTDVFGRLWWDRPAYTIRTEFFKPEKGRYLHPKAHRPLTHREAARLQTFSDEFVFEGSKIEVARQIGNAVPPLLARRVGEAVVDLLHSAAAPVDAHSAHLRSSEFLVRKAARDAGSAVRPSASGMARDRQAEYLGRGQRNQRQYF